MFFLWIFLLLLACMILFYLAFRWLTGLNAEYAVQGKKRKKKINPNDVYSHCPLCNSGLIYGEKLISKVYPSANGTDQRCMITGCPHCFPYLEEGVKRNCPVCGKKVPAEGALIARMFIKPEKNHVHIIGCTECHKRNVP